MYAIHSSQTRAELTKTRGCTYKELSLYVVLGRMNNVDNADRNLKIWTPRAFFSELFLLTPPLSSDANSEIKEKNQPIWT